MLFYVYIVVALLIVYHHINCSASMSRYSIKQAINVPALRILSSVVRQPSLIVPHIEVDTLAALDFQHLKSNGVKCLVFDKDNTLR